MPARLQVKGSCQGIAQNAYFYQWTYINTLRKIGEFSSATEFITKLDLEKDDGLGAKTSSTIEMMSPGCNLL